MIRLVRRRQHLGTWWGGGDGVEGLRELLLALAARYCRYQSRPAAAAVF